MTLVTRGVCPSLGIWKRIAAGHSSRPNQQERTPNRHGAIRRPASEGGAGPARRNRPANWKSLMARRERASMSERLCGNFFGNAPVPEAGLETALSALRTSSILVRAQLPKRQVADPYPTRCDRPIFGGALALIPVTTTQSGGTNRTVAEGSQPSPSIAKAA